MSKLFEIALVPTIIFSVVSVVVSYIWSLPFYESCLFGSLFLAGTALVHWPEEKPGGIDNPELNAPHYPRNVLISWLSVALVFLLLIIYR